MKKSILIVEDEKDILELVRYNLEKERYKVICAQNGEKALDIINRSKPDLVILDLMLPGLSGLEVCKLIKKEETTADLPVVMLTAKSTESDIVVGLELGADDYITKPFSPTVLVARVKAILRRKEIPAGRPARIVINDLVIDSLKHRVTIKNTAVDLTVTEFGILEFLAKNPGKAFSRDQLLSNVWPGEAFVIDRTVDVHLRALRKKLGKYSDFLETVRGVGYRFREF